MVARWLTQNLLDVPIIFGPTVPETGEDLDQSVTEMETELATETEELSIVSSDEAIMIQRMLKIYLNAYILIT